MWSGRLYNDFEPMNDLLLATKLHLPILRRDFISRGQLVRRLNAGLWQDDGFVRKLSLVSAPAGFGKTTLVCEWLSVTAEGGKMKDNALPPFKIAWFVLDESDNDPVRFLTYLIAAIRQIQPEFGHQTRAILQLPQPLPPDVIMTSLVNELTGLSVPFILTLDDYHVIHTPSIHQQISFILDHQPVNMHLVMLTREDPMLPVARLRAHGQLLEIRQEDLRFTTVETAEFLQRETGLALGADDVAALEQHTEGWPAGLQLAALSMRECADLATFIRDFTASERYILDYLVEEVFERQPAETQTFLLQTSILNRLCGPLCDAIMRRNSSMDVLRSLERANLFIVPLDLPHTWYRYHHLFAELLRHRLHLSGIPESGLHERASEWYESQGFLQEAIDHALLAQDWTTAARLIGAVSESMFDNGEVVTLLNWCHLLPFEIIRSSLELCLIQSWAALMTSHFDLAETVLERAEQLTLPGSALQGQVASAQAFLARAQRDSARAIEKSEQALALLPETSLAIRGNIAMNLGLAYWHEGRLAEAEPILRQACDLCDKAGNRFALLTAQIFLARIPAVQGKLHQAAQMCEQLIQAAGQVPILCLAYYDLASIYLEWNDLPKALEHFEKGFAFAQRSGNVEFIQAGFLQRAILAHANGDEAEALAAFTEADHLSIDFPTTVRSRTAAFGVQLALARNDPQMLMHWSAQVNADVEAHSFYRFMGLTRVRLLMAEGNNADAAELLKTLYETASQPGWGYGALIVRILQGLAAKTTDEANHFITEALRRGCQDGFIRSFVEAGSEMIPLLQEAVRLGIEPEYTGRILASLGAEKRKETRERANLPEALSERELEVLRLVTAGLSNREIAAKLVISPGTAKTHIHNLCGKLDVRNRTEAAMKAKELLLV